MNSREINAAIAEHLFDGKPTVRFYTETWAGMGEVVAAMGKRGLMLQMTIEPNGYTRARFSTAWGAVIECPGWIHIDGPALAVSLAALKALGVEVPA